MPSRTTHTKQKVITSRRNDILAKTVLDCVRLYKQAGRAAEEAIAENSIETQIYQLATAPTHPQIVVEPASPRTYEAPMAFEYLNDKLFDL